MVMSFKIYESLSIYGRGVDEGGLLRVVDQVARVDALR
jgi:hypothetical protein